MTLFLNIGQRLNILSACFHKKTRYFYGIFSKVVLNPKFPDNFSVKTVIFLP
jgi:hypothetical protein